MVVFDARDAELETRECAGEGRDQIRISTGGIKPGQDGFERGGIRKREQEPVIPFRFHRSRD